MTPPSTTPCGTPFEFSTPTNPGVISRWNWPIAESALFPGAEVAFIDAEDTQVHCGFETPSSFAKAFRAAMSETPRAYRFRVTKG